MNRRLALITLLIILLTATPTPAIGTIQLSGVPAIVQLNETTRLSSP